LTLGTELQLRLQVQQGLRDREDFRLRHLQQEKSQPLCGFLTDPGQAFERIDGPLKDAVRHGDPR
jgi:hypothetical protein